MGNSLQLVRGGGLMLVFVSLCGQIWLFSVLSTPTVDDWVLYLTPTFGLLGFAGFGTFLTSFLDR